MSATLALSAGLALTAAAVYAYAARVVSTRPSAPADRPALLAFAAWWAALSVASLSQAAIRALALVHVPSVALVLTQRYLVALVVCVGVAALLSYIVHLRWGSRARIAPVLALYAAVYVYYLFALASSSVNGVTVGAWRVELQIDRPGAASGTLLPLALLVVPPMIGALLLWPLVSLSPEPEVRYRGRLVAAVVLGWFGSSFLVTGIADADARAVVSHALGLAAVILTLLAYHPPAALRRRWAARA